MLEAPTYISLAETKLKQPRYSWHKDQDVEIMSAYSQTIERLVNELTLRASLTLGIGIGEWMVWTLNAQSSYTQVFQYMEALWARTVDKKYLKVTSLPREKDQGDPIVGPLSALELALYGVLVKTTTDHPERGKIVAQLTALVVYVLVDHAAFDAWLSAILDRFRKVFGLNQGNRAGEIVPRAFLDPAQPIEERSVPLLLDEQLRSVEWTGNPFLATPEEMIAAGFKGIPYRYPA